MIEVTEAASQQIAEYFKGKEIAPIRIFLNEGGWGGPSLAMALDEPKENDDVHDINGFQFIMDKEFFDKAKPVKVDFLGYGFSISSSIEFGPSACGSCGSASNNCGWLNKIKSEECEKGDNSEVVAFFMSENRMPSLKSEKIVQYHETTKHHYERYANSPGYMDWDNQPNPFRFYEKTALVRLPLLKKDPVAEHLDLYDRSDRSALPFNIENIAGFLELSL